MSNPDLIERPVHQGLAGALPPQPSWLEAVFIARRAVRRGAFMRQDLVRAFGISAATATRHVRQALEEIVCLRSVGKKIVWSGPVPPWAGEAALLEELEGGADARITGVFEDELPVQRVRWVNNLPQQPGMLAALVRAIAEHQAVSMIYVGLRRGERNRIRHVAPLALQQVGSQWSVLASDLEAGSPYAAETFLLSRISHVTPGQPAPRDYAPPVLDRRTRQIGVRSHPDLTADQRVAVEHEFGIENGSVRIDAHAAHEFLRLHAGAPPGVDVVWPALQIESDASVVAASDGA